MLCNNITLPKIIQLINNNCSPLIMLKDEISKAVLLSTEEKKNRRLDF